MALHTVTQFAQLCGKPKGHISTYVKRGKIIKSGKFIDDTLRENQDFMRSCGILEPVRAVEAVKSQPDPGDPKPSRPIPAAPSVPAPTPSDTGQYEMNLKAKDADIELKHQRLVLLQLEEERIRGNQIPTEFVRDLVAGFSKQIIRSYKDLADKFLIEVAHSLKIPDKRSAELKGIMVEMINKAHDKAIDRAISDLEAVVSDQKNKKKKTG